MASGHVNRTIRPNTWPQPTKAQYVQKVLANREPSTHGTSRKGHFPRGTTGYTSKADAGHQTIKPPKGIRLLQASKPR